MLGGSRNGRSRPPRHIYSSEDSSMCDYEQRKADRFMLLQGVVHIKYVGLVKYVMLLIYLLRSMQTDLTYVQQCRHSKHNPYCIVHCQWLYYLASGLPTWVQTFNQQMGFCSWVRILALFSVVFVLWALYCREQYYPHRFLRRTWRIFLVIPSIILEAFLCMLISYSVWVSLELIWIWPIYIQNNIGHTISEMQKNMYDHRAEMAVAIVHAAFIIVAVIAEVISMIIFIAYICQKDRRGDNSYIKEYTCGHSSPNNSLLEILKNPMLSARDNPRFVGVPLPYPHHQQLVSIGGGSINNNNNNDMMKAPSSVDSGVGYGRLRQALMRSESDDARRLPPAPLFCRSPMTTTIDNNASYSEYSQIRNLYDHADQVYSQRNRLRSSPRPSLDDTYLEVE